MTDGHQTAARKPTKVVGGMALVTRAVLTGFISMEATRTQPTGPLESRGTHGKVISTF